MDSTYDSNPTPEDSIDSLAQVLSKQNLRLDEVQPVRRQSRLSSPSLSPQIPSMDMFSMGLLPALEVDDDPQPSQGCLRTLGRFPSLNSTLVQAPTAMEVEERPTVPNNLRLRRQQSSHFNNNPSNSRTIQDLVEGMIATGSQCNVHRVSPPPLTPTPATTRLAPIIEPDVNHVVDVDCMELEVDEAYLSGAKPEEDKEELSLLENMLSLRRAGTPGGIRKLGLLQYRGSADAALRCANVVRSRPRMRKRRKTGPYSSRGSSVVSSSFSSPVIPPSLPDDFSMAPPPRRL